MAGRLLIVEDNADSLKLMSYLLRSFGHQVRTAGDGATGLVAARQEAPDLIICDIQLPEIDGYEVARQLKADPRFAAIPLIAVTALAMVGDRDKVLAAGFDGYITKPIVPRTFVNQVEAFLPHQPSGPHTASVPTSARPAEEAGQKRGLILVVDNTPVNIELTRKILEPFDYAVMQAASVQEAMAKTRESTPDLILADLYLSRESGYDLVRMVKTDPTLRRIPYVFLSSSAFSEYDRAMGLALGADKFLIRPISPQTLLAEIEECLKQRKEPWVWPRS